MTNPARQWRARVEAELAGAPYDKALVTRLREGLALQPVYSAAAGVAPPALFAQRTSGHWRRTQAYRAEDAEVIASDLAAGTDGVWLSGPHDLRRALSGVDLARVLLAVDQDGEALLEVLGDRAVDGLVLGSSEPAQLIGRLDRAGRTSARAVLISTRESHDAGAHAVLELAIGLSTAIAQLRALDAAGIPPARAAARFAFAFAIGREVFVEIAKLRAARLCWVKLLAACGVRDPAPMWIHAETSRRMLTTRDPWVNMLRVTTATFAGAVGGADSIASSPFDGAIGVPDALGRRVARNTSIVLAEESHLGEVVDPAAGSYAIEQLTDELARAAWAEMQAIEAGGGAYADRVDAAYAALRADVARRRHTITGVSEYPDPEESPLTRAASSAPRSRRDAEPFEALRARVEQLSPRPTIYLATLGSLTDHAPRESFARGYFGVAGVRAITDAGGDDVAASAERFAASGATLACICGTDAAYGAHAAALARALTARGARRIFLAGRPGPDESVLREAGVHDFVFLGSDVEATLARLVQELAR